MAWKKFSSGVKTTSELIYNGPCFYFGFTTKTGKTSYAVVLYDALTATGTVVENYQTDANKEMDGHVHNNPVLCRNGLYLSLASGSAVVYYAPYVLEGVK